MTVMDTTADQPTSRRSKLVTLIAWLIPVFLAPLCCAWVLGRSLYWFDVLASEQMLISWVALALGVFVLASRRWIAGAVCIALVCVSLYPLTVSRVWSLPTIDLSAKPDGVIRVVSCNLNPKNEEWESDLLMLMSLEADVIVLIEASPEMSRALRKEDGLTSSLYSHWVHRMWVMQQVSAGFILSRWPIEELDYPPELPDSEHLLFAKLSMPQGEVIMSLLHPHSPRTQVRWEDGNRVTFSQSLAVKYVRSQHDLPIIIGADLNAGPAQSRGGVLRSAGMRMSKPITRYGGSFPIDSTLPGWAQLQLDDLWYQGGIEPVAWDTIPIPGSDHLAVITEFRFKD